MCSESEYERRRHRGEMFDVRETKDSYRNGQQCMAITVWNDYSASSNSYIQKALIQLQAKLRKNMPHVNSSTLLVDVHIEKQVETILKAHSCFISHPS
jgi:hypothetical protein